MKELINKVIQWANNKGILEHATPSTQFTKTQEEVAELEEHLQFQALNNRIKGSISKETHQEAKNKIKKMIKDDIGDITVTLIIQAKMQGLDFEECLQHAYDQISKRKGKMIDGFFVKDEYKS